MKTLRSGLLLLIVAAFCLTACESKSDKAQKAGETVESPLESKATGELIEEVDLERHREKHYVLLLFTPSADHDAYRSLLSELDEKQSAFAQRDLRVYHLEIGGKGRLGDRPIAEKEVESLRKSYAVLRDGFTFVLLDKVVAPLLRAEEALPADTLIEKIDEREKMAGPKK